jgi:cysteine desulfurase/selenocysteine lyase
MSGFDMNSASPSNVAAFDAEIVRRDFPILQQQVNGQPLVYLDSAATTQKPLAVLDAMQAYYLHDNANVHRAAHALADRATTAFEQARQIVAAFINSPKLEQVIWTRGTTESINLVAHSFGRRQLQPGDKILVSTLEHHSNIVPWQLVAEERGATVEPIPLDASGDLDLSEYRKLLDGPVKLVAINQVSNALGTVNPVKEITELAHAAGARVLIDGAQAVAHFPVDVQELLEQMPPYQGGGEMIETVSFSKTTFNHLPYKFEAGTPDIAGAIGMGAALRYLQALDRAGAQAHESRLLQFCIERGEQMGLQRIGAPRHAAGVYSFILPGAHPADVGTLLDQQGVAVRTGHHCTQPLMAHLGLPGTVRASLSIYNTQQDLERLFTALEKVKTFLL